MIKLVLLVLSQIASGCLGFHGACLWQCEGSRWSWVKVSPGLLWPILSPLTPPFLPTLAPAAAWHSRLSNQKMPGQQTKRQGLEKLRRTSVLPGPWPWEDTHISVPVTFQAYQHPRLCHTIEENKAPCCNEVSFYHPPFVWRRKGEHQWR